MAAAIDIIHWQRKIIGKVKGAEIFPEKVVEELKTAIGIWLN